MNATHSDLWGKSGEKWDPQGRLPDFSFAGYHSGEQPIPEPQSGISVLDFGAVGDGQTDCTEAFRRAIAESDGLAIEIPKGQFIISDILWIRKPNVVLRGEGSKNTIILPTTKLEMVRPRMSSTTEGLKTSSYSWSGGFIWIHGQLEHKPITKITAEAVRGAQILTVKDTSGLNAGQMVTIQMEDSGDASIIRHLYVDDEWENIEDLSLYQRTTFVTRIQHIRGKQIILERFLPFDIRLEWNAEIMTFAPEVTECGIENLSIKFPTEPYGGHFKEWGMNAVAIDEAAHCWVRDVEIHNADSGIFLKSHFSTIDGLTLTSNRPKTEGDAGHHGVSFSNHSQDNLLQNFDFQTRFIHDITVENGANGNVVKRGRGLDLSLDHHRLCPNRNLFTQVDVGKGESVWRFGGGPRRGKHTGRGATFWGISSQKAISHPGPEFGPEEVNFVGLDSQGPSSKDISGLWWEAIPSEGLQPSDLHQAQLTRRLQKSSSEDPDSFKTYRV
ncbi:glycosyl hydrolase family 28-related protein [Puniceicoccus vermicola]|uniref:Rhamnogalacturonase A/B/Epimerase-like pectate lyase domain-containing protein n=1 Tax=Puniceicoccus vermicola TaxID=388746 RepID=A0A7X1E4K1_9BACT|nr:glycosyl hydrolase family 28-related protein [Puniceicoccus vermicola]MBC2602226.1 hypothetical protein [Puniceicoccus vermicola]